MSPVRLQKPKATPLLNIEDLRTRFGVQSLCIKDESQNPFGTIKDRRSYFLTQEGLRQHVDKFALITSGNNGYSLGMYAQRNGINVVCLVDRQMREENKHILRETCHHVVEVNLYHRILRPEEVISFARERDDEVIWDVTNGYEEAYRPILKEIQHTRPTHIVVPVGSGGIFTGLATAIEQMRWGTRVIGMGVQEQHGSYADKLHTPWTPYAKTLASLEHAGHKIYRLPESRIRKLFETHQHRMDCEPSSSIVFGVFDEFRFSKRDRVVLINSGRNQHVDTD